ncbi:hypothetical protein CSC02_0738 [Enterobacter hormaechei subsp. hoffmannii]|nr:hypothetical protein CSC02_0738 [Enterobacter hormaechei subsp. hoffmannii]
MIYSGRCNVFKRLQQGENENAARIQKCRGGIQKKHPKVLSLNSV